jgi:hypothetical protein
MSQAPNAIRAVRETFRRPSDRLFTSALPARFRPIESDEKADDRQLFENSTIVLPVKVDALDSP